MNVFLSHPNPYYSFRVLDNKRLGKQRVELKQIILALETNGAWSSHPATRMLAGHIGFAAFLGQACCDVWIERGFQDSLRDWFTLKMEEHCGRGRHAALPVPPAWFRAAAEQGDCDFYADVRANLVRKSRAYNLHWPDVEPREGYRWPEPDTHNTEELKKEPV